MRKNTSIFDFYLTDPGLTLAHTQSFPRDSNVMVDIAKLRDIPTCPTTRFFLYHAIISSIRCFIISILFLTEHLF